MTYTELRDFLNGYTDATGTIHGDPAIIAAEAVAAGLVEPDENHGRQFPNETTATPSEG